MKTQNVMTCSYQSKVTSAQNKGVSFFSCLGHGVQLEAAIQRCSVEEVFLEILQNSQENTCASVSFLIKLGKKKRLWYRYFHVSFAKFLRAAFLIEHVWWLLLFSIASSCLIKIKVSPITPNLTFNVCMKTVNEFCVSNGAKWLSNRL